MSDFEKLARRQQLDRIEQQNTRILELLERAQAPAADEVADTKTAAPWIGMTPKGLKAAAHRDPELAALALRVGRARRWKKSDLLQWAAARRPRSAPKLRAVGGHP